MNKLQPIAVINGVEYLSYKPSALHLYADCYRGDEIPPYFSRVVHHVRMQRERLRSKPVVVYLRVDGKIAGHLVVTRGGTRIAASDKNDIVIGPIWITPQSRSKGLGSAGINAVLHGLGFDYRNAYEFIEDDNIASVRTVEHNGFTLVSRCAEYGPLKKIKENKNGNILVYKYSKREG